MKENYTWKYTIEPTSVLLPDEVMIYQITELNFHSLVPSTLKALILTQGFRQKEINISYLAEIDK